MIGVALSLGVFLFQSMRPNVTFPVEASALKRSESEQTLPPEISSTQNECESDATPEDNTVATIQFEGSLFFANAGFLEDIVADKLSSHPALQHLILAAGGINDIDASGVEALERIIDKTQKSNITLSLCAVNTTIREVLTKAHVLEKIEEKNVYPSLDSALSTIHEQAV